ncbi:lysophospholipase [Mycolicibacterium madagascariense]|uniref:Lysophospholipase n=1 Tax=Mycolicibacterium madagascariense TaxID=212765 RepID=A0A7I7XHW1_9MYCO|nr:SGNH/GDSL hydrolase family protein [Mycolicibacterium madagascariense]MCV7015842.1 SGNH/GDSL hydrolase family protein [Mycolicibacterium madagascariense]BBZ28788.1 lysophospholipase [Mycolicibacterium madagascariense]
MAAGKVYQRYVAIGDSQTEGLWDGDDATGVRGFADRLAERLEDLHPGVRYANLAVRGRRIRDVLDDQLPAAVAMRPDLITSCIGMNDVTRPGRTFDAALADIDVLHQRLAETGATIVTTTFPDLAEILPVGRFLAGRVLRINAVIRAAADRHGFRLVDLYGAPSLSDPAIWSPDRVHGSPAGHAVFAAAAADALNLPGSSHDWAIARGVDEGEVRTQGFRSRMYSQALWTQNLLAPWVWRHLRGLSSGNGREPKRPRLTPVGRLVAEAPEAAE